MFHHYELVTSTNTSTEELNIETSKIYLQSWCWNQYNRPSTEKLVSNKQQNLKNNILQLVWEKSLLYDAVIYHRFFSATVNVIY